MRAGLGLSKCSVNSIYYQSQRVLSALGGSLGSPSLSFWVTGGTVWPPGCVSGTGHLPHPEFLVLALAGLVLGWVTLSAEWLCPLFSLSSGCCWAPWPPQFLLQQQPIPISLVFFSLNWYFPVALWPSYREPGLVITKLEFSFFWQTSKSCVSSYSLGCFFPIVWFTLPFYHQCLLSLPLNYQALR